MASISDSTTVIRSHIQDLSFKEMMIMLLQKDPDVTDMNHLMERYHLLNDDGDYNLLALLMSDQNPHMIRSARFEGTDKGARMAEFRAYYGKSLLVSVEEILIYMDAIDQINVECMDISRVEKPLFPFGSFKEALLNACMHTEWRQINPPLVSLFDDRICVTSIGGLPFSEDEFFNGKKYLRNIAMAEIFTMAFGNEYKSGIAQIIKECGKDAFRFGSNFIDVNIPFAFEPNFIAMRKR